MTVNKAHTVHRPRRQNWFSIAVAFIMLCLYAFLLTLGHGGQQEISSNLAAGSSQSSSATGSLALAKLWGQLHLSFTAWEQPPNLLPQDTTDTFVSVEPIVGSYPENAVAALMKWVKSGHTVVMSASGIPSLSKSLHLTVVPKMFVVTSVRESATNTRSVTLRGLSLPVATSLGGPGLSRASTTYTAQTGAIIGATFRLGNGSVTVFNVPMAFENKYIDQAQNFRVVWGLVGNHPILWDEYGHGVVTGGFIRQMFQGGRAYALLFLLVSALLYLVASFLRFGRARSHAEDASRQGTEFMNAFSTHLQSPRLHSYQVELMANAVWRNLASKRAIQLDSPSPEGSLDSLSWKRMDEKMQTVDSHTLFARYATWRRWHAKKRFSKRELERYVRDTRELLACLHAEDESTQ